MPLTTDQGREREGGGGGVREREGGRESPLVLQTHAKKLLLFLLLFHPLFCLFSAALKINAWHQLLRQEGGGGGDGGRWESARSAGRARLRAEPGVKTAQRR